MPPFFLSVLVHVFNDALLRSLPALWDLALNCEGLLWMELRGRISSDDLLHYSKRLKVRSVLFESACTAQETAKGLGFAAIGRRRLLQSF